MTFRQEESILDKLNVGSWQAANCTRGHGGLIDLVDGKQWKDLVERAQTMSGLPLLSVSDQSICRINAHSQSFLPKLLPGLASIIARRARELAKTGSDDVSTASLESLLLSGNSNSRGGGSWCQTSSTIRHYLTAAQWIFIMYLPSRLIPDNSTTEEQLAEILAEIKSGRLLHEGLFFSIEFWDSLLDFQEQRGSSVCTNFNFSKMMRFLLHWCTDNILQSSGSSEDERTQVRHSIAACTSAVQKRVATLSQLVVMQASDSTHNQRLMDTLSGHLLADGEASELFRFAVFSLASAWRGFSHASMEQLISAIAAYFLDFECALALALTVTTLFGVRAQVLNDLRVDHCVVSLNPHNEADFTILTDVRDYCLGIGDRAEHDRISQCVILCTQQHVHQGDGNDTGQPQSESIVRVRLIDLLGALPLEKAIRTTWRLFILRGKEKVDEQVRQRSILVILPCVQPFFILWIARFWSPIALGEESISASNRNRVLSRSFWMYRTSQKEIVLLSSTSRRMSDLMTNFMKTFNPTLHMGMTDFRREVCTRSISPDNVADLLAFLSVNGSEDETEESARTLLESFLNVSGQRMAEVYARNNPDELVQQRRLQEFATRQTTSIASDECSLLSSIVAKQLKAYQMVTGADMDELMEGPLMEAEDSQQRLFSRCVVKHNGDAMDADASCIYDSRHWSSAASSVQVYVESVPLKLRHTPSMFSLASQDSELVGTVLHPSSLASRLFDCHSENTSLEVQERWSSQHSEFVNQKLTVLLPKQLATDLQRQGLQAFLSGTPSPTSNALDKLRHCMSQLHVGAPVSTASGSSPSTSSLSSPVNTESRPRGSLRPNGASQPRSRTTQNSGSGLIQRPLASGSLNSDADPSPRAARKRPQDGSSSSVAVPHKRAKTAPKKSQSRGIQDFFSKMN